MTLLEQIQQQLRNLPPEKQREVIEFVTLLQQRMAVSERSKKPRTLR